MNRSASPARLAVSLAVAAALCLGAIAPPPAAASDHDPLVGLNRKVFGFNDALDRWFLAPVARGYDFVMPEIVEGWINNFFVNLWFPVTFANCVLQAKPEQATQSLARFLVNSTFGLGGFGDPASRVDIPAPFEDFGQTLGHWGVPPGPYLVIPLLGPSNVRDTFGRAADSATRVWPYFVPWYVGAGAGPLELVSTRELYLKQVDDMRRTSVDYYAAARDAYVQRRAALVADRIGASGAWSPLPPDDDLYFPGEDDE